MLTTEQKARILDRAGIKLPQLPLAAPAPEAQQMQGAMGPSPNPAAVARQTAQYDQAIDTLFVQYTTGRAARSLREAEQVRLLEDQQRTSARRWR